MNIDSIKNGIVIDHITAGKGMELYKLLNLETFITAGEMEVKEIVKDKEKKMK
mgnify:CR=1 FL=1